MFNSSLFASEYLFDYLLEAHDNALEAADLGERLSDILKQVPPGRSLSEADTESKIVEEVLDALGWGKLYQTQVNLDAKGRFNVPDYLLFNDEEACQKAIREDLKPEERLPLGVALLEAKKWEESLERKGSSQRNPSQQIVRYLMLAQGRSSNTVRWGILTNGRIWRLYFVGASSILNQFVEFDLAAVTEQEGTQTKLPDFATEREKQDNYAASVLRLFHLLFRPQAFHRSSGKGLLEEAFAESRQWEEKVAADLRQEVFDSIFPLLINALYEADPEAPRNEEPDDQYLEQLRVDALILLYRLLFILYAEDRKLLPVEYDAYFSESLRKQLREDIETRTLQNLAFGSRSTRYWDGVQNLRACIDEGDRNLGVPRYNGGLFQIGQTPILNRLKLTDSVFAPIFDKLSRRPSEKGHRLINYRDLSVQQLGTVYEGLLEYQLLFNEAAPDGQRLQLKLSPYSRKSTGSYYTPEPLVALVLDRSLGPLVKEKKQRFLDTLEKLKADKNRPLTDTYKNGTREKAGKLSLLAEADPALAILQLRILDPAMGSGHFLVSLVDWLADQVGSLIDEAPLLVEEAAPEWHAKQPYRSPVVDQLDDIRQTIRGESIEHGWKVLEEHLEDRHIARRIILKRSVYGVDKNPMAVELAKLALWLHTFTVGAPLSFIDHHVRCGDSLFGEWIGDLVEERSKKGYLFLQQPLEKAMAAEKFMHLIESLADSDIYEVKESEQHFQRVRELTDRLDAFLSVLQGFRWITGNDKDRKTALEAWLDGNHGDPVETAYVAIKQDSAPDELLLQAARLAREERFFNWQAAFPGVWHDWKAPTPRGGFDLVVGNPPWDVMKIQQIEWFAVRDTAIAMQTRADDRKRMIAALKSDNPKLWNDFQQANERAEQQSLQVRTRGKYPLLGKGDLNLYFLFVERVFQLAKADAIVGLVVPSGIVSDKRSTEFMQEMSPTGRIHYFYDFENRKIFFPDVHASFKFCTIIMGGPERAGAETELAFFQHTTKDIEKRAFRLKPEDFRRLNPNTGTAPVFRTPKDAELTLRVYERLPILHDHSKQMIYPVKYVRMFDMTNDSHHFLRKEELEKLGAYTDRSRPGKWKKGPQIWVPLLEGKSIHQYNHRYASIFENKENLHNAGLNVKSTPEQLANPSFAATPRFWVDVNSDETIKLQEYFLSFRDIARSTDERTIISTIMPIVGAGNKLPILIYEGDNSQAFTYAVLLSIFNSFIFDYIARQKLHSTSVNLYIFEQLPVVPPERYEDALGNTTVGALVRDHVLRLSYTAHDLAPFARDLGHVDAVGAVLPPFVWNEAERAQLRARLDALYFILYGLTDPADIAYILESFPIVRRNDEARYGSYRTLELIQQYVRALEAGDWEVVVEG